MLDVILSPEVDAFVAGLPEPVRGITRRRLVMLGQPSKFLSLRPLVGRGHEWRVDTVGPFVVTCKMLRAQDSQNPADVRNVLMIATIDRAENLRSEGRRLIEEGEGGNIGGGA